jgi:hypothetical protein
MHCILSTLEKEEKEVTKLAYDKSFTVFTWLNELDSLSYRN